MWTTYPMKYEKSNKPNFLGKWRYRVTFAYYFDLISDPTGEEREIWRSKNDRHSIENLDFFMKSRATGEWLRKGNVLYLQTLDDAFNVRLFFDQDIKFIHQATD